VIEYAPSAVVHLLLTQAQPVPQSVAIVQGAPTSIVTSVRNCWPVCAIAGQERVA
jgi:hypothetical protein